MTWHVPFTEVTVDLDETMDYFVHAYEPDPEPRLYSLLPVKIPTTLWERYQAAQAEMRAVTKLIVDTYGQSDHLDTPEAHAADKAWHAQIREEIRREDEAQTALLRQADPELWALLEAGEEEY